MQTHLGHIQFNVQPANLPFYKDLLIFLGWQVIYEADGVFAGGDTNGVSFWFIGEAKDVGNDYDGPGVNHLGISVAAQTDVDATVSYLAEHGVEQLFETPRHRPEFSQSDEHTYYQVMFETPDRLLIEVVYIGAKTA